MGRYKPIFGSREEFLRILHEVQNKCIVEAIQKGKFGKRGLSADRSYVNQCIKREMQRIKKEKALERARQLYGI